MKPLFISDHAVLRFAERVLGLDRISIETAIENAVGDAQEGSFPIGKLSVKAVVSNGTVVTVAPTANPRTLKRRKNRRRAKAARIKPSERELVTTDWRDLVVDSTEGESLSLM